MTAQDYIIDRIAQRYFVDESGCWLWTGRPDAAGYGRISIENKVLYAHRVSYELHVGPIPDGMELDHLCRNRACINPKHLEAVTHKENIKRGLKGVLTTECPHGHPYDEANTYIRPSGARACKACRNAARKNYPSYR